MLASVGVKAPTDELTQSAAVHEQVAERIASVRFTTSTYFTLSFFTAITFSILWKSVLPAMFLPVVAKISKLLFRFFV